MLETVLAVLVITFVFLTLFKLSHLLTGKILLEHAAMRVARARAVGLNEFMCVKAARICVIPVSGKRLQPVLEDERTDVSEASIARMYMRTPDSSYADGLLRYEKWDDLSIVPGRGGASKAELRGDEDDWTSWSVLRGEAEVDRFPIYMNDQGL